MGVNVTYRRKLENLTSHIILLHCLMWI